MWHQLNANAIKKADSDTKRERGRERERDRDKPRLEVKRIRRKVCPIAFKPDQIAAKKKRETIEKRNE